IKGKSINSVSQWRKARREEIISLFESEVYGRVPKKFQSIEFKQITSQSAMGGKAILKQINIVVTNHKLKDSLQLTLFVPAKAQKPPPVFLLINNRDKSNTDPTRVLKSDFWPAEMLIDSGYAIASFQVNELAPDDSLAYQTRFLQLFPNEFTNYGTRTISMWAFGASRAMDYLQTDSSIDPSKVVLVGHSRGGKAALWASANDERFAMCIANCSGNTGAAIARRRYGQTIKMINQSFPHWFAPNYKNYNDQEDSLPIDQHQLIALTAPRPIYITSASEDKWADPKGMYLALFNSQAIYQLYGLNTTLTAKNPAINTQVTTEGVIGFHHRLDKHDMILDDWNSFR
ncbi:MAG: acetylxylan esterase, partial [Pedobacter sp.]